MQIFANTLLISFCVVSCSVVFAENGGISRDAAKALIEIGDLIQKPIVLNIRGGYKDYFRALAELTKAGLMKDKQVIVYCGTSR